MSLKHLTQGSVSPKLASGVLRFYNMRFCPYAQRTLIVLKAKNIDFEMVNIHLKNRPDWFYEKNPLGKVPVLEQDGKVMIESLVTSDYLDDVYPNPPLYPKDPWEKAIDQGLMQILNMKVVNPLHKALFNIHDQSQFPVHIEKMKNGLKILETDLTRRGTKFFGGKTPAMLDYMIWPWGERLPIVDMATNGEVNAVPQNEFPKLYKYFKDLSEDPAVKSTILPFEQHLEFFASFARGEPDYDHGLDLSQEKAKL